MLQLQHYSAHWKSAVMLAYAKNIATLNLVHCHNSQPFEIDKSPHECKQPDCDEERTIGSLI